MWLLYSLLALFIWGIWTIFFGLASRSGNYIQISTLIVSVECILALLFISLIYGLKPIDRRTLIYIFIAGVCGILGLVMFSKACSIGKLSIVVPLTSAYPIIAVLYGVLIGEAITKLQILGIVSVIVGILLISI
ncbi:MAG: EamA family transporter [bacterium]